MATWGDGLYVCMATYGIGWRCFDLDKDRDIGT